MCADDAMEDMEGNFLTKVHLEMSPAPNAAFSSCKKNEPRLVDSFFVLLYYSIRVI